MRGAVLAAAVTALIPLVVPAAADARSVTSFLAPAAFGTADFGDRVPFRLAGRSCSGDVRGEAVFGGRAVPGARTHGCSGAVALPSLKVARAAGWREGTPIAFALVAGAARLPLRYQRTPLGRALDAGTVAPLGRADLAGVDSVSLRSAGVGDWELRAGSPTGAAIAGGRLTGSSMAMTVAPLVARPASAPRLYLIVTSAPAGPVDVEHVDLNGSGASLPYRFPADPRGMKTIFDGSSLAGWSHAGPGRFELRDGAMRAVHQPGDVGWGWQWYTRQQYGDFVLRLRFRYERFGDNGGVLMRHDDPHANPYTPILAADEVQLTDIGEQFTGGIAHVLDAERLANNSTGEWSSLEIVAVGSEFRVRVEGREVTRFRQDGCTLGPCRARGYVAVENESFTGSGGHVSYDDIRIYECRSRRDPVCAVA